jgi:hypothetical protein
LLRRKQQHPPDYFAPDPTVVGELVAKEIAEAYYEQNPFHCTSEQELLNLFTSDVFGMGVRPYEHLRCFEFGVDVLETDDEDFAATYALLNEWVRLQKLRRAVTEIPWKLRCSVYTEFERR